MTTKTADIDIKTQPVTELQLEQLNVEWVEYELVQPNDYNPNKMSWHDMMLLRQSVLEDGWTQPIVTLPDGVIVDGEQRWSVAGLKTTPADVDEIIDKMNKRAEQGHEVSQSVLSRLRESRARLQAAVGSKP